MQGCFRQYPEIYGSEIDSDDNDDDDDVTADAAAGVSVPAAAEANDTDAPVLSGETNTPAPAPTQQKTSGPHSPEKLADNRRELGLVPENYRPKEKAGKQAESGSESEGESESLVPKAAHDGR